MVSVTSTSSLSLMSNEERTVFTPVVALLTKAIPLGSAFRKSESRTTASDQSPLPIPSMKLTGSDSIMKRNSV